MSLVILLVIVVLCLNSLSLFLVVRQQQARRREAVLLTYAGLGLALLAFAAYWAVVALRLLERLLTADYGGFILGVAVTLGLMGGVTYLMRFVQRRRHVPGPSDTEEADSEPGAMWHHGLLLLQRRAFVWSAGILATGMRLPRRYAHRADRARQLSDRNATAAGLAPPDTAPGQGTRKSQGGM